MSDLPKRLRIKASMIALGERVAWGSDTALMEEAADVIEALSASVENHQLHMLGMARDRDQLRALLTAQPQASAAQSAPAGEREAMDAAFHSSGLTKFKDTYAAGWEARAARQRKQSAWAPDVSAMARVLSDRSADACNIDRTDNWAMYGQEYIEDVQAMLASATTVKAEQVQCAFCDDTGQIQGTDCGRCAPSLPAAGSAVDEVQRLREALELSANRLDRLTLEVPGGYWREQAAEWAGEARAASTGQEVE